MKKKKKKKNKLNEKKKKKKNTFSTNALRHERLRGLHRTFTLAACSLSRITSSSKRCSQFAISGPAEDGFFFAKKQEQQPKHESDGISDRRQQQ